MAKPSILLRAAATLAPLAGCHAPTSDAVPPVAPPPATVPATAPAASSGIIGVHDQVRCQVSFEGDDAEPTVTADRVDDAGRIPVTMLAPVPVAGLSESAAADAIVAVYRDAKITAHVKVTLVEHARTSR